MFYLHVISNISCAAVLLGAGIFWAVAVWRMAAEAKTRKAQIGLRTFAIVQLVLFASMAAQPVLSAFDQESCVSRCEVGAIQR